MELYYTDKKNIFKNYLRISNSEAHHIIKVMRHKLDDTLFVTDGEGNEYKTIIKTISNDYIEAVIINKSCKMREPITDITLAQSIIKGNRMDFVIEKATELGVREIIPLITERTITSVSDLKMQRYQKIMLSALKSSTRTCLPILSRSVHLQKLFAIVDNFDLALLAWENEKKNRLSNIISTVSFKKVLLILGPEGGFTQDEIQRAISCGIKCFTMGPRRLRSETASLAALTLLMHELKEI